MADKSSNINPAFEGHECYSPMRYPEKETNPHCNHEGAASYPDHFFSPQAYIISPRNNKASYSSVVYSGKYKDISHIMDELQISKLLAYMNQYSHQGDGSLSEVALNTYSY